ncbi:9297_t:CDS:2 [Funneliformis caledonium]|uniref:9297_t:CDS:1 n=1 Tax=Funneliformis caledonium TaxID=1117310 RepID=A0A9N9F1G9_9GLOM|nr:9297_t:CDS:2 [Funneliformis caledonium]
MGRDPTTIRRFINKYKKTVSIENLPRSGRPPALNIIEKNALVNEVKRNRRAPLHEVVNTLQPKTAKTILYEAEICSRVAAKKKPFISERHAAARISWYEKYKEKSASYRNQVIFSDESSVEITTNKSLEMKFKSAPRKEWENLDCTHFEAVVASMPRRINAELEANGGPTKY